MKKSASSKQSSHIVVKKAKDFFDEKVKAKHRFISLYGYLESITEAEQAVFLNENHEQAYIVTIDVFASQIEKMKGKENASKQMQSNGKETQTLNRILNCLRKIIQFNQEVIHVGWQKKNLVTAFSILLASNNHIVIRSEGFGLLLLWINYFLDEKRAFPNLKVYKPVDELDKIMDGALSLYSNSIFLYTFDPFPLPLPLNIASSEILLNEQDLNSTLSPWAGEGKTRARQAQIQGGFVVDSSGSTVTGK